MGVESAVVPWVILEIGWGWLSRLGKQEDVGDLMNQVHVSGIFVSDIGSAVAQCCWGDPSNDSEVDQGFRLRRSRGGRATDINVLLQNCCVRDI